MVDDVVSLAPAGCQWNNPLLVVPKPGGNIRVCLDPRPLNKLLISGDNFPIPVISDILDLFAGAVIFSALDLKSGYNQFTINEADRPKLAFTWNGVQYMFKGAPFGVTHLSSVFQRVVSAAFAGVSFVVIYIDNIYIFSASAELHEKHIRCVFEVLNKISLRLNFAVSSFSTRAGCTGAYCVCSRRTGGPLKAY